jgi:SAM-dependent methyltransferase
MKMAKSGPEFYDDETVFSTYMSRRHGRTDGPNDILEKPIIDELTGALAGLRILDLGCGDALYGVEALQQGCRSYLGLDGSRNMIDLARSRLEGTSGKVEQAAIEAWRFPERQFDLVVSRLALHYVEDISAVFANIYRALAAGGRFIFSVEHPVITSSDKGWQTRGPRQDWIVDDYFETGPRQTLWMNGEVIKYHRTVEDYFMALRQAGFVVDAVRESRPKPELFTDPANYERRKRIPLMLFFSVFPPATSNS